jgi:hypothetical protein
MVPPEKAIKDWLGHRESRRSLAGSVAPISFGQSLGCHRAGRVGSQKASSYTRGKDAALQLADHGDARRCRDARHYVSRRDLNGLQQRRPDQRRHAEDSRRVRRGCVLFARGSRRVRQVSQPFRVFGLLLNSTEPPSAPRDRRRRRRPVHGLQQPRRVGGRCRRCAWSRTDRFRSGRQIERCKRTNSRTVDTHRRAPNVEQGHSKGAHGLLIVELPGAR